MKHTSALHDIIQYLSLADRKYISVFNQFRFKLSTLHLSQVICEVSNAEGVNGDNSMETSD